MYASVSAVLLGAALVAASPVEKRCALVKDELAKFDDIMGFPGDAFETIPKPYKGLAFDSFDAVQVINTGILPGPKPESGNTFIAAGVDTEFVTGDARLSIDYQQSRFSSFTLNSFFYGCVANEANGATAQPLPCTITVAGYTGSDNSGDAKQVCEEVFHYDPDGEVPDLAKATVKTCKNASTIKFNVALAGGLEPLSDIAAVVLDNVAYTLYDC